jgi:hypothetical protein
MAIQDGFVLTLGLTKGTGSRAQRSACPLCLARSHSVGLGKGDRHLAEYSRSQSPFPRPTENETTLVGEFHGLRASHRLGYAD